MDLIGSLIAELIRRDDCKNNANALHELVTGVSRSADVTKRFVHSSGAETWGDVNLSVLRDDDGTLTLIVRVTEDRSQSKRVQDERDRLFSLSLDMLCIANFDGGFLQVNPTGTRVLGWSSDELEGRPLMDFVHPDDRAHTVATRVRTTVRGVAVRENESRYLCKDGSVRWLSWSEPANEAQWKVIAGRTSAS